MIYRNNRSSHSQTLTRRVPYHQEILFTLNFLCCSLFGAVEAYLSHSVKVSISIVLLTYMYFLYACFVKHNKVITNCIPQTDIKGVAEEANDKHLTAWADLSRKYDLSHSPLEPSAGPELLLNKQLCLDGGRLRGTGFEVSVPRPTEGLMREVSTYNIHAFTRKRGRPPRPTLSVATILEADSRAIEIIPIVEISVSIPLLRKQS